ncbi:aldo/keto reductase [Treponema zuelzerae]|uniref:Aldo/keto reductase n=1 Tax=Teretinema zuelzerae TaxID=156 RepID=A0AAE3JK87_9SPIR|nr:aldo/keto reductase [Teretinema zuelzerae]MBN2811133.1 aldo/keto reductase [Spirochaetales bacterium]MCD1653729.1 aldo/keto reductase [Teretinema zuelzerae]
MSVYKAADDRYGTMHYRRCGRSGLKLPEISLGLWHNFGGVDRADPARDVLLHAFDKGITHFDLANNYGPPPGSAETFFGSVMDQDLRPYRDELVVSTKAGYGMWDGPYGDWGSRKYLVSSLDQSLARMKLDYVDIFYHHRPDPETPLEETMGALDHIVRSGKALYAGISNYGPETAAKAISILRELGTPCLIHQARYSMLDRWVEDGLTDLLGREGVGMILFSPLAQGLLSSRYLTGEVPSDSRAARGVFLKPERLTPAMLAKLNALNDIAQERGETLSALAIKWLLKDPRSTSVLIGASSVSQLDENLKALEGDPLSSAELSRIETVLAMPE